MDDLRQAGAVGRDYAGQEQKRSRDQQGECGFAGAGLAKPIADAADAGDHQIGNDGRIRSQIADDEQKEGHGQKP